MRRSYALRLNRSLLILPLLACLTGVGCGGDGTHHVSGKVTFKGQPVPAGTIFFTPDSAKGNTGPTGYAEIKDGQYDTSASGGKGVISGPMIVRIEGYDPSVPGKKEKGDTSGEETAKLLFANYEVEADLTDANTKDFDVPAEAAGNIQIGERRSNEIVP